LAVRQYLAVLPKQKMADIFQYVAGFFQTPEGSTPTRGYYFGSGFPAANVNTPYTPAQTAQDAQATAIRTVGGISGTDLWQASGDVFERPNVAYTPPQDQTSLILVIVAIFLTVWFFSDS
jgi:hypothetical protein